MTQSVWQPIETAPKDGSKILLHSVGGEIDIGRWSRAGGSWFCYNGWYRQNEVRAWAPLPKPLDDF